MADMFARARKRVDDEGLFSLFEASLDFISNEIEDQWLKYRYRQQYGEIAPQPNERLWVDPNDLAYTIAAEYMYDGKKSYPNYGILDGDWDQHKSYWENSSVWGGLRERFEENKEWEETSYYQFGMDKLNSGESVAILDGPQTVSNFERYLESLDDLYRDIKTNGYDRSSVIVVHIGRDGDWMVGHGNHRRTLACLAGVDSVPVRVKFRHKLWQDRRQRFHEAESIDEIPDSAEFLSHPDIPETNSD